MSLYCMPFEEHETGDVKILDRLEQIPDKSKVQ